MRIALIAAALVAVLVAVLITPAQAQQVFKCSENGKTVFSDHPCGDSAQELDVRPSRGGYDPGAAARIDAERQAKVDKCREIREARNDAKYWAGEFQHKDNIRREEEKAKSAQDALWWECREVW